jgi:hypothetical protein
MMRFGTTTFAGLVTSVVTVAGLAVVTANALAEPTVYYKGAGLAASESVVVGEGLRSVYGSGSAAAVTDSLGASKATFFIEGNALGEASVAGSALAYFSAQGDALGTATATGTPYKRLRVFPLKATGDSEALGDSVVYAYGAGQRAIGSAQGIGTTWHVVRTAVAGEALGSGNAIRAVGVKQRALAEATASVLPHFQIGGAGLGAVEAIASGDAAVTVSGVLYYAANGRGLTEGYAALATVSVYQPQRAVGESLCYVQAQHRHGGKGKATSSAIAIADANKTRTGVSNVIGDGSALALGQGVRAVVGSSTALSEAYSSNTPTTYLLGAGRAVAESTVVGGGYRVRVAGATLSSGVAQASGYGRRTVLVQPVPGLCEFTATGFNQVNDLVRAPLSRTSVVFTLSRTSYVLYESRTSKV